MEVLWLVLLEVVGALGDACNGGAMVHGMELLLVPLPLLVCVVVVVALVDFPVNIS